MVTSDGNPLEPQITIPPNAQSITIAPDGTVSYTQPGQTAAQQAGQIQLAHVPESGRTQQSGREPLSTDRRIGRSRLSATPAGRKARAALLQGYTEQSNVSVVDEFVNLIVSQRAYEANSKVVKAADEMYQGVNELIR